VTREPDSTGFDAIVAAWRAEGNVPQWPDDPQLDEPTADSRTGVDTDPPEDRSAPDRPAGPPRSLFDADDEPPARGGGEHPADGYGGKGERDPDADDGEDGGRLRGGAVGHDHEPDADDPADGRAADGGRRRGGAAGHDGDPHADDATDGRAGNGQAARAGATESPTESPTDEHFVPPEPPPLPRMGPPILVGLVLIGLGLVLVTFPGWVGVPQVYGLPLGLVAIAAGLGWLVLRLWPDPDDVPPPLYLDDPDDPDGGAVL
jgi:hypothetical protein